jgi:hypothetical protein
VINGALPIGPRKVAALIVGNGYKRHVVKPLVQRHEIRDVEAAMNRGDVWNVATLSQRKVKIPDVKMDDIEGRSLSENLIEHDVMMCQRVVDFGIEA